MGQKLLKAIIVGIYDSFANVTTASNAYVDVGSLPSLIYKTVRFRFAATTNNLKVQILGSVDGGATYTETVEAEFTLLTSTPQTKSITTMYTNLKVQVKPAVDDTHGTLATKYMASSN